MELLTTALGDLISGGPADPPQRRSVVNDGVNVRLARIGDDLSVVIKGSFSPILMWGRAEAFFTEPVDELGGQTVYAAALAGAST